MKFLKRIMYEAPKYLPIIPFVIAIVYIIVGLTSEETIGIIGADGRFVKPFEKILGLSYYWFFLILGIITTIAVALLRREKYGFGIVFSIVFPVLFFLQALLGAKLLFGLERVMTDGSFSSFNMSGQSLYGTLFTTFSLAPLAALLTRKKLSLIYDYIAPFWMILLIFCRMGCFTDRCCGADMLTVDGQPFYLPVQLFEMILDLAVLAVMFHWESRKLTWDRVIAGDKTPNPYHGTLFFSMLVSYGVYRFILEIFRDNPVMFMGMTFGQIYCVIILIAGSVVLLYRGHKYQLAVEKLKYADKHKHRKK